MSVILANWSFVVAKKSRKDGYWSMRFGKVALLKAFAGVRLPLGFFFQRPGFTCSS